MGNDVLYDTECLIYPWAYVPLLKEEEVQSALTRKHEGETEVAVKLHDELKKVFEPITKTALRELYEFSFKI